jgi:hypothetical protein
VDTFHGVEVQDPYRWMEDNNSETLKNWVQEQNKLTFGYLETIPEREKIKERLTQLWNYERFGIPTRQADRYFIYKNDGLQNQSVLYTMTSLEADLEELHLHQRGRPLAGLRIERLGLRLARVARAQYRDPRGYRGPYPLGEILERRLAQGWQRLLLLPLR